MAFAAFWTPPAISRFHGRYGSTWTSRYDVRGDRVTIRTELAGGATYTGIFSAKMATPGSGGWRPDEGMEGPVNVAYDITATRVRVGGTTIVHMRSPAFGDLYNTWEYREILPAGGSWGADAPEEHQRDEHVVASDGSVGVMPVDNPTVRRRTRTASGPSGVR
jgi:hypothetical protein